MEYFTQLTDFGNRVIAGVETLQKHIGNGNIVRLLTEGVANIENNDIARVLVDEAQNRVLQKICETLNVDQNDVVPTFLVHLFMSLKDPDNHDASNLFHDLMSHYNGWEIVFTDFVRIFGNVGNPRRNNLIGEGGRRPNGLPDLCTIMSDAATSRHKIKAVSTNYSALWTNIGSSTGIIIDTSRLKRVLPVNFLKNVDQAGVYRRFEAGIKMSKIQKILWPLEDRLTDTPWEYRVLENVTSGSGLSLAGTVSTGAHGNGLNLGNVASAVVSFQMFTIDSQWGVKMYQIEKESEAITDPVQFREDYPGTEHNFPVELIQNDEVFNATVVNVGCMGVVYSYVLRTVPGFCLAEERTIYKWSEAKHVIRDLYQDEDIYNFQIIGSPYAYKLSPTETAEHRVLISVLRRADPPGGNRPPGRNLILPPIDMLDKALVAAGYSAPHVIPIVMHFSLQYLKHERIVLNAVEALNTLAGVVSEGFSDVRSSECAMRSSGAETVIEIMEDLQELYNDIRRSNDRQLVNVPTALRFTSKSDNYMAMEYDCHRPTITIEQSIMNGTLGADDTLRKFRKRMLEKFQGRPHWGLLHELDAEKVNRLYDANCRQQFIKALESFDPKRVFENEFADWVFGRERRQLHN